MVRYRGRAPHKPLLLLAALGRINADLDCPRLAPFQTYDDLLKPLLASAGVADPRSEFPFVRAVNDGLWDVPGLDAVRAGSGDVTASRLKGAGLAGGLHAADDALLRADGELRLGVIEQLLDLLPETLAIEAVD
jgi:hypothetical protein